MDPFDRLNVCIQSINTQPWIHVRHNLETPSSKLISVKFAGGHRQIHLTKDQCFGASTFLRIAQMVPISFLTSIPHKTRQVRWGEVRCTFQWSLIGRQHICISYSQEDIKRQLKKISNGRSSQFNQYLSYKPHLSFKPTWIFSKKLCVLFKWYFGEKLKKKIDLGTGGLQQRQEVY